MFAGPEPMNALVVSSSPKTCESIKSLLQKNQFSQIFVGSSAGEARRILSDIPIDILLINTPLSDEFGTQFALDVANNSGTGVLLFVKSENYEAVSYKVESAGVLTMSRPVSPQLFSQSLRLIIATRAKLKNLYEKNSDLQEKMKEVRILNRAKWLLVDKRKMSEPDAHRYIEKNAMDRCVRKKVIALEIIDELDKE
ncbi:MAG: ANTAR domain-containing protein [Candidatus Limousia pullorum]|nr:ANTAR domain-containing protein [Candidatus Limousia pullorum]